MTIKEVKDLAYPDFLKTILKPGLDPKYKLELDQENWEELQNDIRSCGGSNFVNGLLAEDDCDTKDFIYTCLRIPYVGEFEIIKSDNFKLTKIEE